MADCEFRVGPDTGTGDEAVMDFAHSRFRGEGIVTRFVRRLELTDVAVIGASRDRIDLDGTA